MLLTNRYERFNTSGSATDLAFDAVDAAGPRLVVGFLSVAAAVIAMALVTGRAEARRVRLVPLALLGVGGLLLAGWAGDTASWAAEVNWRVFDVALMAPAFVALVICLATREGRTSDASRGASAFALGAAVVTSLVLVIQSVGWHDARAELRSELESLDAGCVTIADVDAASAAPIGGHWSASMLSLEEQGLRPHVVVLARPRWCRDYLATGTARLWPWEDVLLDRGADGEFRLPAL
jgi:hypothetical protein